ncbi:hypothetical protein ACTXT7_017556, partial [Hymenolepis weldensis]
MWTKLNQENRSMHAKGLSKKLKHSEEQKCLWFYSNERASGWVDGRFPLEFQPLCMRTKFPPTVMLFGVVSNADAYVETLQTIVVKPPYMDNVANGGESYVFQQDSAPSLLTLKTHDWMDSREFSSSCHTTPNLWPPPNYSSDLSPLDSIECGAGLGV